MTNRLKKAIKRLADVQTDKISKEEVTDWFKKHPNPDDDDVHAFAESLGIEPHVFEEIVYSILTEHLKQAIKKLSLNINKKDLHTLWYEDDDGNKFVPRFDEGPPEVPEGYKYQWSRFPTELTTNVLEIKPDGTSTEIMVGHSTWPEDLMLAMVESGNFTIDEAIIVASESCSRCLNVLANQYGLDWGYKEGSEEWQKANTECEFCRGL